MNSLWTILNYQVNRFHFNLRESSILLCTASLLLQLPTKSHLTILDYPYKAQFCHLFLVIWQLLGPNFVNILDINNKFLMIHFLKLKVSLFAFFWILNLHILIILSQLAPILFSLVNFPLVLKFFNRNLLSIYLKLWLLNDQWIYLPWNQEPHQNIPNSLFKNLKLLKLFLK